MTKSLTAALLIALSALSAPAIASAAPIQEDDPAWSCTTDGNRICGPDNANGVLAGCYGDAGTLVAAWPCTVVVDENGDTNAYTADAR